MTTQDIGIFGQGGFPGSTSEAVDRHPVLSPESAVGDASIRDEVNASIVSKQGRRATQRKTDNTSVYTQVTEELREEMTSIRNEMRSEMPAKFMKVRQPRRQVKARMEAMSPEERRVLAKKYGVRRFAGLMQELGVGE